MKILNELYADLEIYKNFDANEENAEKFLNTVDKIVLLNDPSSIAVLLHYFDDNSDYSWVMESLSGCIEHYPMNVYIDEILKNFHILFNKAKDYLFYIFCTIFNSPSYVDYFRTHMYLADRKTLLMLFDLMEKKSPHYEPLIHELRDELMQSAK